MKSILISSIFMEAAMAHPVNVTVHNVDIPLNPEEGMIHIKTGKHTFDEKSQSIEIPQEGEYNNKNVPILSLLYIKAMKTGSRPFNVSCLFAGYSFLQTLPNLSALNITLSWPKGDKKPKCIVTPTPSRALARHEPKPDN